MIDIVDKVIRYESGMVDDEVEFFQDLIDDGIVWSLQGAYGRKAMELIMDGKCHPAQRTDI